jgi:hypothetical protein
MSVDSSKARGVQRPSLAHSGEVWEWLSGRAQFYIISENHRNKYGQMYWALNVYTATIETCFMTYDRFNGWQRIA